MRRGKTNVWLLEASPRDPATAAAQAVRLAGGGVHPYRYLGGGWKAGLDRPPVMSEQLAYGGPGNAGGWGQGSASQALQFRWAGRNLGDIADLYWRGADCTLKVGPDGGSDAEFAVALTGKIADARPDGLGGLVMELADPGAATGVMALNGVFAGTGGLEGPAELRDRPKRRAFGRVFNVELWPWDTASNLWIATDPARALQAFDVVSDKGNAGIAGPVIAWQGSIAATKAALAAAAAPDGGYASAPSIAAIKWWYPKPGLLTADIKGEVGAAYVETVAEIADALVGSRTALDFQAGSIAAWASARPGPAGLLLADPNESVGAALERLLAGAGLWWMLDAAGAIEIGEWAWGAAVADVRGGPVKRTATFAPTKKRIVGYKKNERPMQRGEIAGAILVDDVEGLATIQQTANDAAAEASSALGRLDDIDDDNVWTPSEKIHVLIPDNARLEASYQVLIGQAATLGVTTEATAATNARNAWIAFRDAQVPAWSNVTTITVGVADGRDLLQDYESAIEGLRKANVAKAAEIAKWDGVSGAPRDGTNLFRRPKPEGGNLDGWTLGSTWTASNTAGRGWTLRVNGLAAISDAVGADWVAVQPGDVFHAEWETFKGNDGANGTITLYADVGGLTQVATAFDVILSVTAATETAGVWTGKRRASWTVPAGCYWVRFRLSSRADHTTGTWWINAPKVASYAPGADVTRDGYAAGVQPGAVVLQTSGAGVLLGLQALMQTVSDGTVVIFSPAFDRTPIVEFDISSLPAVASGESLSARAESLTASGFTTRVKKRTTGGTPVSLSTGTGTAVVAGEDYQVSKGDSRDARDGVYNFRVKGQLYGEVHDLPAPEPSYKDGYLTLEFWAKVSSVWQSLGQHTVQTVGPTTGTESFDKTYAMTCTNAIGDPAGNEFKVTVAARGYTATTDKITELTSVSWQADGTAVTETAVTQSVIAKVRPVNA